MVLLRGILQICCRLLKGGVSSGLNHVTDSFEPRLFRVKGRRSPVVRQMLSISWEHFNKGDVFIIDTNDVIFVWIGSMANKMEKLQATKVRNRYLLFFYLTYF